MVDFLSDEEWDDLDEVEENFPVMKDKSEKLLKLFEDAGIVEVRKDPEEKPKIRGTETMKDFKHQTEEEKKKLR